MKNDIGINFYYGNVQGYYNEEACFNWHVENGYIPLFFTSDTKVKNYFINLKWGPR